MTARPLAVQVARRVSHLLIGAVLTGCATTPGRRNTAGCGSLPPAFDAPIRCPTVEENVRTVAVDRAEAFGFSIERAPSRGGGLRIPPQTVTSFVEQMRAERQ